MTHTGANTIFRPRGIVWYTRKHMHQYEIEIKSLLGSEENAHAFRESLRTRYPETELLSTHSQLNHYFEGGDPVRLYTSLADLFEDDEKSRLKKILTEGTALSVRTRQMNEKVLFVVKASIDDTTSENGIARIEFESEVDLSLSELDQKLLDAGLTYQAKWSRAREEYRIGGVTVCVDKNAGYGYLAEFERVVENAEQKEEVERELRLLMRELDAEELSQDRLERMFTHYNQNWLEYYGTEKVFTIE